MLTELVACLLTDVLIVDERVLMVDVLMLVD